MEDLFSFLDRGVSPYHSVEEAERRLKKAGFVQRGEGEKWELEPGGKYFVRRNQSSIIAFVMPAGKPQYYHLTASHSDSPFFRIKKEKTDGKYYAQAEIEGYGGMIQSSWIDRPLGVAGRIIVHSKKGVQSKLVAPDKDVFVIPNLAIHFNRETNKGYSYNIQKDLQPLYGGAEAEILPLLAMEAGIHSTEDILDSDLILVARQKACVVGTQSEFYMSPRIDDLAGAYTSLMGFLEAQEQLPEDGLSVWCMFDNEEVGSGTRQGAMGNFLPEVSGRIEESCGMTREERAIARSRSLLVSVDNAHALHPNYPEKSDVEFPVILNKGVVIKYNASQRYTTTGMTGAVFVELCKQNKLPFQRFANRADSPGGSTLGNLLSHQFSIPMVDVGLPQLAMHSAVETAGCKDVETMKKVIKEFYKSRIRQVRDGEWVNC